MRDIRAMARARVTAALVALLALSGSAHALNRAAKQAATRSILEAADGDREEHVTRWEDVGSVDALSSTVSLVAEGTGRRAALGTGETHPDSSAGKGRPSHSKPG